MKPYIDKHIQEGVWERTFDPTLSESEEYVWHRDLKDRRITCLEGEDWKFQFDNEIPFNINIGEDIFVPKMVYHRIIPGSTKLRIRIDETL